LLNEVLTPGRTRVAPTPLVLMAEE